MCQTVNQVPLKYSYFNSPKKLNWIEKNRNGFFEWCVQNLVIFRALLSGWNINKKKSTQKDKIDDLYLLGLHSGGWKMNIYKGRDTDFPTWYNLIKIALLGGKHVFLELKARFKKVLQTIPSTSVILNTEMSVSDLHEKLGGFFTQLWALSSLTLFVGLMQVAKWKKGTEEWMEERAYQIIGLFAPLHSQNNWKYLDGKFLPYSLLPNYLER